MKQIEFYFDFLSPYSYLACLNLDAHRKEWMELGFSLLPRPTFMSTLISAHSPLGPAEIEAKRNYLFSDILRYCALLKIPFVGPPALPFNSLWALRFCEAVDGPELKWEVIQTFFKRCWGDGLAIDDQAHLLAAVKDMAIDGNEILEKSFSREVKSRIKVNASDALKKGAFGVPSLFVDDQLFWGNDSIRWLEKFVMGEDLLNREKYNQLVLNEKYLFLKKEDS